MCLVIQNLGLVLTSAKCRKLGFISRPGSYVGFGKPIYDFLIKIQDHVMANNGQWSKLKPSPKIDLTRFYNLLFLKILNITLCNKKFFIIFLLL